MNKDEILMQTRILAKTGLAGNVPESAYTALERIVNLLEPKKVEVEPIKREFLVVHFSSRFRKFTKEEAIIEAQRLAFTNGVTKMLVVKLIGEARKATPPVEYVEFGE